jgi:hypothetical protein
MNDLKKPSLEKLRSVFLGHVMFMNIPPRKEKDFLHLGKDLLGLF